MSVTLAKPLLTTRQIPNTDLTVSRIAYGVAVLDVGWHDPEFNVHAMRGIQTAYDNGITFFDFADCYAHGKSEAALGSILKESPGLRKDIVIQTKCGLRLPSEWSQGGSAGFIDLRGEQILRSVEASLERLGTDHLDILLFHWADMLMEPEDIAQAFDKLHSDGKVRYFGVCNHGVMQLELIRKYAPQPIVINQIPLGLQRYAPITRTPFTSLSGVVDYCRVHDIQVEAFSPLRGRLLEPMSDTTSPQLKELAALVADIAREHDTHPSAILLAWLLRHPAGIIPIIGASDPRFIVENCEADHVDLSHEEWHYLFRAAADIQEIE